MDNMGDPFANPASIISALAPNPLITAFAQSLTSTQKAVARYFGQGDPDFDAATRELQDKVKTETYMILRPQYWRGQQHGSADAAPHARHMRPLCVAISSSMLALIPPTK